MKIQVQHITEIGAGAVERAHLADHGQDGWEGAVGVLERDMEHWACVDDAVDGLEGIVA